MVNGHILFERVTVLTVKTQRGLELVWLVGAVQVVQVVPEVRPI